MSEILKDFVRFLDASPTVWHAARQIASRLTQAGFKPLYEDERWQLEKGQGYFVVRDDAALLAFRTPTADWTLARIAASHLDSPALKLKPIPDLGQHRLAQLSTEVYGSPQLTTWLDRDLALAGRVIVQTASGPETHIVCLEDAPMTIPSLPPHLDRSVNDKGLVLNRQDHLRPVVSISQAKNHPTTVESLLRKHLSFEQLLSFDLFLIPLEKAALTGQDGELISSYRLDNLTSAYACLNGLIRAPASRHALPLSIFWDHEEIGSKTYLGAESLFVAETLERIASPFKIDREDLFRIKSRSHCLSVDLAHGYNPNYSEKFDAHNAPYLGDGVVLKTNAMQKYATNATTALPLIELCRQKGWMLQKFASRADIPSGSTVGSIMSAVSGIPTVDIGIAGWSMHSIRETIAAKDELALCDLLTAYFEAPHAPKS